MDGSYSFSPLPSLEKRVARRPGDLTAPQLMTAPPIGFHYTTSLGDNMIPQNKNLKPLARKLRNNATRHENRLWYEFLRNYPVQFN